MKKSEAIISPSEPLHILVVDDDPNQVELVCEYLQFAGGYITYAANEIDEVWHVLAEHPVQLMLLDYRLHQGNGLEILEALPGRGYNIPVVMVTGEGDEQIAVQAIRKGALDYVVKSGLHLNTLPGIIRGALRTYTLQQAVERSREQVRYQALLLNNVRDAVVVWDLQGQITYWNPAAHILFGYSARERAGQPANEAYCNLFQPQIQQPDREQSLAEAERQYTTPEGRTIWVSSRVSVLRDYEHNNAIIGYMDVCRDITQKKLMERLVQTAQSRLAEASRMAAIGQLSAGVAHQINNPLTTIIADSQLLMRALPEDFPDRDLVEAIQQAGWRTQAIVQQLVEFSRPLPRTQELVDINQAIGGALMLIGASLASEDIEVITELAQNLPPIKGYARQIQDLWVHLLLIERTPNPDGTPLQITIRTTRLAEHQVLAEVQDNGQAIPPEVIESLFEPDLTRPTSERQTGMEYSICREIIRQHHGIIHVQSTPEEGTTFSMIFPSEQAV